MTPLQKTTAITLNASPVMFMIGLIPIVENETFLTVWYLGIIGIALAVRYESRDWLFLLAGLVIMIISESLFVSTGVETFTRRTLLGQMPLWLPVLWAYAFVAMRRAIVILEQ